MTNLKVLTENIFNRYRNLILYGVIGASGALLDYSVFLVLFNVFHINPVIATALSATCGIINNFFLNIKFNFKVTDKLQQRFALFFIVGFSGLLLSMLIVYLLHDMAHVDANIAKAVSIPIIVICQYLFNSRLALKQDLTFDVTKLRRYWIDMIVLGFAAVLFFFGVLHLEGFDEIDNLLGGKLIWQGQFPYSDFFSHHMPGMYWLSALFYPFVHTNIFLYRLLFNVLLFVVLIATYSLLRKYVNPWSARMYALLIAAGHVVAFGQMALGESLVSFVYVLCIVLIMFYKPKRYSMRLHALISILLATIPLFSLSYIFAAAILYVLLVWRLYASGRLQKFSAALQLGSILAAPYLLFFCVILLGGSFNEFIFSNFKFNSQYYAPLIDGPVGGIAHTFTSIVVQSIHQLGTLASNILNPTYLPQLALLLGYILFIIYLMQQRRSLDAAFMSALLLVIDPLVNVFNGPAMTGQLDQLTQHALVYINTSFLAAAIAIPAMFLRLRLHDEARKHERVVNLTLAGFSVAYLCVVPVTLLIHSMGIHKDILVDRTERNFYSISKSRLQESNAPLINAIAKSDDYAWVGPADFASQLYLTPRIATRYTFFLPWQDTCQSCRRQFLSEFTRDKPKVIFWGGYTFKGQPYRYNADINDFLISNYFQVRDPRLRNYNFIQSDRNEIIIKLRSLGYEA